MLKKIIYFKTYKNKETYSYKKQEMRSKENRKRDSKLPILTSFFMRTAKMRRKKSEVYT
jgi:hypothetical protein